MLQKISRHSIATGVAVIFHAVGLAGIFFFKDSSFLHLTWFHLLLMAGLISYTHTTTIHLQFFLFIIICFFVGMGVELYGTSTGELFGLYKYGNVLGPGIKGVPYIIGINWFVLMYCCGTSVNILFDKLYEKFKDTIPIKRNTLNAFALVIDGAFLAVITDFFLEPAAIKLGYWQWLGDGTIPFYNYVSWFVVSAILLAVFRLLKVYNRNLFAVNLLLMQILFFFIVSSFL